MVEHRESENYIHISPVDAKLFKQDSFRTKVLDESRGIMAVFGELYTKPNVMSLHKYMFNMDKGWTTTKALAWYNEHKESLKTNSPVEFQVNMADIAETETSLSVPVVFTKEGIHNGLLKPYEEIKTTAKELVGKPVVIGHPNPKRPVDLKRDPVTGEVESCNARDSDKSLHGRIRIDKTKTPQWLIQSIKAGTLRGGSLGYYGSTTDLGGFYMGKPYSGIERDLHWDHYAIGLQDGAAHVKDGCGLRFNSEGDDNEVPTMGKIKQFLTELIKKPSGENQQMDEAEKQKYESKIEKLQTQIEKLQTDFTTQKTERDGFAAELKTYKDKEAAEQQTRKDILIADIVKGTDEKPDVYKEWSIPQLEHLKARVAAPTQDGEQLQEPEQKTADKTAIKPPNQRAQFGVASSKPSIEVAGKELTIGNSLFGKKPGES